MQSHMLFRSSWLSACVVFAGLVAAQPQGPASSLQGTLSQSTATGKFTFIVFHRDSGEATRALHHQIKDGTSAYGDRVTVAVARVDDPAEQGLVQKFGIARAPMPLTVVVAPNGAVTGVFPRAITNEQIAAAIVSPAMMRCMKELQEQKLVFVCLTRGETVDVPPGVQAVRQLPQFKDRISLVGMRLDDPAEARFYQQMRLDPQQVNGTLAVLIAPPGVLIGHYGSLTSADEIAAAIHQAGKCCDDPNCKHNHGPAATAPSAGPR